MADARHRFWAFDGDTHTTFPTEEEVRAFCQTALDWYRDQAGDEGWNENVERIMWGEIRGRVTETERRKAEPGEYHSEYSDYSLTDEAS